jgi:dUTP pyrophosphatase
VLQPTFIVNDETFAPRPSHPGDAGADIKACVSGGFDEAAAVSFYRDFESYAIKYGYRLYIDGEVFTSESESEFLQVLKECGGGVFLPPGETFVVDTGFRVMLPRLDQMPEPWNQFVAQYKIVPRSGLAINHGVTVTNSPGIIDSGYRGWVKASISNETGKGLLGDNYHVFTHGARIAQGLCELAIDQSRARVTTDFTVADETPRASGGFGSTGV